MEAVLWMCLVFLLVVFLLMGSVLDIRTTNTDLKNRLNELWRDMHDARNLVNKDHDEFAAVNEYIQGLVRRLDDVSRAAGEACTILSERCAAQEEAITLLREGNKDLPALVNTRINRHLDDLRREFNDVLKDAREKAEKLLNERVEQLRVWGRQNLDAIKKECAPQEEIAALKHELNKCVNRITDCVCRVGELNEWRRS